MSDEEDFADAGPSQPMIHLVPPMDSEMEESAASVDTKEAQLKPKLATKRKKARSDTEVTGKLLKPLISGLGQADEAIRRVGRPAKPNTAGIISFLKLCDARKVSFDGGNPNQFLRKVEQHLQCCGLSGAEAVSVIGMLCRGVAEAWYTVSGRQYRNWEEVKTAFRGRFLPSNFEFHHRQSMTSRKQEGDESLLHFIALIRLMNDELAQPLSDDELIHVILANMNSSYWDLIGMSESPKTFSELELAAKSAENVLERRRHLGRKSTAVHVVEEAPEPEKVEVAAVFSGCFRCGGNHYIRDCPENKKVDNLVALMTKMLENQGLGN